MSSPPVKYLRYFDFTTFASVNPEKPLPGGSVDVEFNRLKSTTDQTIDRLNLIQRDDGLLRDGAITTNSLADGAVTTPKIADGAVTGPKLYAPCVSTFNLVDQAVTTPKLGDLSVSTAKLQDLSVTTSKIADGAITGAKIAPGSLTGAGLAPGSITSLQLADGGVATVDLADGAVTEPKLAALSVSTRTLQDLSVTTAKHADLSVTQAKLALLSVGTPQLIDGAVTNAKLGAGSVDSSKILDGSIGLADLAPAVFAGFAPAAHTHPEADVVNLIADLALKAPLASPAFTGVPTAPTALTGTATAQIATTQFVSASMSAAGSIGEAPNDGKLYGRQGLGWQLGVKLAGDTMTGPLLGTTATWSGTVNTGNTLNVQNAGSAVNAILIQHDGAAGYFRTQAGPLYLGMGGNNILGFNAAALFPLVDNSFDIGAAGSRYKTVYGVNGDFSGNVIGSGNSQFAKLGLGMAPVNILDITQNQNATSKISLLNNSAGAAAAASIALTNGVQAVQFGQLGTAYTTNGAFIANRAFISASQDMVVGAGGVISFAAGGTAEKMQLTAGGNLIIGAAASINAAGLLNSTGTSGVAQNVAFGITNNFGIRGFVSTDYCEVSAAGNLVRLAAPGGGGGNWTVVSERAKKRDIAPLPGDPFKIINHHAVKIGRYITDPKDAPLHAFLFFEDAIAHYPYATSHMPERTLRDEKTGETRFEPEYKGLSLEAYVPLLMAAMQLVDKRLKHGGL